MHDISVSLHYQVFCSLLTKTVEIQGYKTSSSNLGNFYINISKTNQRLRSFTRFGAKLWNSIPAEIRQYPNKAFKKYGGVYVKALSILMGIIKDLVKTVQAVSLYLGPRLYFNLNQILLK